MTREEAIKILKFQRGYFCDLKGCQEQQAFTMAIKALEQKPCDDAISRQAAQTELKNCEIVEVHDENDNFIGYYNADTVDSIVRNLPPVTPVEKVGQWEYVQYDGNPNIGNWHCSECRAIVNYEPIYNWEKGPYHKFCPMCGIKMLEPQEVRNKE